jgi:hypothetical protein
MEQLQHQARKCTSLKYLNLDACKIGKPHPLWHTTNLTTRDVMRAVVKAKLLTGTYTLQCHRAMYSSKTNKVSAVCQLCHIDVENREHFLTACQELSEERSPYIAILEKIISETDSKQEWERISTSKRLLSQLILDASSPTLNLQLTKSRLHAIEHCTRRLCFALHCKRAALHGLHPSPRPMTKIQ